MHWPHSALLCFNHFEYKYSRYILRRYHFNFIVLNRTINQTIMFTVCIFASNSQVTLIFIKKNYFSFQLLKIVCICSLALCTFAEEKKVENKQEAKSRSWIVDEPWRPLARLNPYGRQPLYTWWASPWTGLQHHEPLFHHPIHQIHHEPHHPIHHDPHHHLEAIPVPIAAHPVPAPIPYHHHHEA